MKESSRQRKQVIITDPMIFTIEYENTSTEMRDEYDVMTVSQNNKGRRTLPMTV